MAKNDNMLAILWLLRSRGRMTAPQLAEALETSVRTIYRYIDALCASGVPVLAEAGQAGGYSLPDHFRSAPLFFEPDELVALFQASTMVRQTGYPGRAALQTALAKVRLNLSPEQEALLERYGPVLGVAARYESGSAEPWGRALERAAAERQTVEMDYLKAGATKPERRRIDPYALGYRYGYWYVVGRCHLRDAIRDFRLDRIRALEPTGLCFTYPADFDIDQHLAETWVERQVQQGPVTLIRVQGSPEVIADLAGHWYVRHCVLERAPEHLLLQMDEAGLPHFRYHLLSFGTSLTVLEPDSLRLELAAMARAVAAHHAKVACEP